MKWLRLWSDIIDDPKTAKMDDNEFRIFILLLALASEQANDGCINMPPEDICWRLRIKKDNVSKTLNKLSSLQIIENTEEGIRFLNWEKRQPKSDLSSERVKRYREKQRNATETLQKLKCNVLDTDTDTDTEIYSTVGDNNKSSTNAYCNTNNLSRCPHQEIINLYHKILPTLPKVKVWSEERQKLLRRRWNEDPKRKNLSWWKKYFSYVSESKFLMGDVNCFQADLEWLIRPRNFIKVIEGKYHN